MLRASAVSERRPLVEGLPLYVAMKIAITIFCAILVLNDIWFTYTLDDAYIHLALASNIAQFHYGLNPELVAAPSSSILWPFLLAPFAGLSTFEYVPLALNLAAMAANVVLLQAIFRRVFGNDTPHGEIAIATLTVACVLALNLLGLAFAGMEHELQVTLALAVLLGVDTVARGGNAPGWLIAAMIAGPLVRYESLSLTVAAAAVLFWYGHRTRAIAALGAALGLLAAFSLFLLSLGLPALPSSVLTKIAGPVAVSGSAPVGGAFEFVARRLGDMLANPRLAVLFMIGAVTLSVWLFATGRKCSHRAVLGLMAFAGAGHLALGSWDALARYEIYVLAVLVGGLFLVFADELRQALRRTTPTTVLVSCCLALALVFGRYLGITVKAPLAANNIYEQQFQMHRFVTEYHQTPVAVNDLGLVSFGNSNFVLDLWGLGSEEARRAWREGEPGWPARLVEQSNLPLVMIYGDWFARVGIPETWTPVARLYLGRPGFSVGGNPVDFYVTPFGSPDATRAQLRLFAPTLPAGVRLEIL
jgi:hypothetical protein